MLYMYSLNIRSSFMTDNLIIASFSNPIFSNTLIDATLYSNPKLTCRCWRITVTSTNRPCNKLAPHNSFQGTSPCKWEHTLICPPLVGYHYRRLQPRKDHTLYNP